MKGNWKDRIAGWRSDLGAGFVVSLVALPLGLALASASGLPPIAGVISSVVGGLIVGLLGGSHVTIVGPGNGLAVIILTAVTTLGGGDMQKGYLLALTAFIVAGGIIALFGFLKLGNLGDFFPSSAVQGILAAIGLILISRQFHLMIGVAETDGNTGLGLLLEIPTSIGRLIRGDAEIEGAIVGIISLVILVAHSKVSWKWLRLVPGPMWVLILSIGFSYYFVWSGKTFPIEASHMIQLPDDVLKGFAFPDFSAFTQKGFISAVFGIALIIYIESLLSIRAVDKLDPKRRRSNINKDLKALGLSTIGSAFAGGMPVVTVIARSSVNVNNGANSRLSNAMHALFLVVFVLFLSKQLQMIPLSALAAILVYTGYKLAEPSVFAKIYKIGLEEFVVFITTLLVTISSSLVYGVLAGIVIAFVLNIFHVRSLRELIAYTFRPNTLLYQEKDRKYYIGIKGFSSFLNYLGLKKQLDNVPRNAEVIVDFSLAKYVDNSVLEHVHHYSEDQDSKGGKMEVIGLDVHGAGSTHPFAARSMVKFTRMLGANTTLTSRQKEFRKMAKEMGWKFHAPKVRERLGLRKFRYFRFRDIDKLYNVFTGENGNSSIRMMDVEYHQGEFIATENYKMTVLMIKMPEKLPSFTMEREWIFDRLPVFGDYQDIDFEGHSEFSKKYKLKGVDEEKIRSFFTDEILTFFEENDTYHIEVHLSGILIFEKERLTTISEAKKLIHFGRELANVIENPKREPQS